MLKGNKVTIKRFETIEEVILHAELYNDKSARSIHDHDELTEIDKRIEDFKNGMYDHKYKVKYMLLNNQDEFIGTIGFVRRSEWEVNIGYRILKPEHRQKGYLSEALPLFLDYLWETDKELQRISLNTAYDNIGSQKVAERSGFIKEGVLRKAYKYRGNIVDFIQYSMIREDIKKGA